MVIVFVCTNQVIRNDNLNDFPCQIMHVTEEKGDSSNSFDSVNSFPFFKFG